MERPEKSSGTSPPEFEISEAQTLSQDERDMQRMGRAQQLKVIYSFQAADFSNDLTAAHVRSVGFDGIRFSHWRRVAVCLDHHALQSRQRRTLRRSIHVSSLLCRPTSQHALPRRDGFHVSSISSSSMYTVHDNL